MAPVPTSRQEKQDTIYTMIGVIFPFKPEARNPHH